MPERRGRGRPRVNPDGGGASPGASWIPAAGQLDRLDAVAARLHTSRNALLRRFVDEGLAREETALGIRVAPTTPATTP